MAGVPDEILKRASAEQPNAQDTDNAPQSPMANATGDAPAGAAMSLPAEKSGDRQRGLVGIAAARQTLEMQLPRFGSDSEEGKAILTALKALSKFGGEQKDKELIPAEIKEMQQSSPEAGGVSPAIQAMRQKLMSGGGMPNAAQPTGQPMAA